MKNFAAHSLYKARCLCVCGIAITIIGCSQSPEVERVVQSRIYETDGYYEVTGLGASASGDKTTEAEAKRTADFIAYIQAVELLAEVLQGIAIQGDIIIRDLHVEEGELIQLMSGRLQGVRRAGATQYERQEDGSWLAAATIRFEKENITSYAEGLRESKIIKSAASITAGHTSYSGIILDLRYLFGYSSLLAPRVIASDGRELFSIRDIDQDILLSNYGIQIYSSINEAVSYGNVGNFPMKLVPREFDPESGAIILSENDGQKFLSNGNKFSLIIQGKIAIIL